MTDQTQTTEAQPQAIAIESLEQFGNLVIHWHHNNMEQLLHILNVPEGQSVTVQLDPNQPEEEIILTGDLLKGFKSAIVVAMNIFDKLPFGAQPVEDGAAAND